jgi:hypothetical protein
MVRLALFATLTAVVACGRVATDADAPVSDAAAEVAAEDTPSWGLDAVLEDTAVPEDPTTRPFSAVCGATTYDACVASSHDVIADVTSASRVVKVQGIYVLADPPQLLELSRGGPPSSIAIDDPGSAVDLDFPYVLTCDEKECRA